MKLFIHHVGDNIWSVRENAAIALGNVAKNFGEWLAPRTVPCQALHTLSNLVRPCMS